MPDDRLIESVAGSPPVRNERLHGGMIAAVLLVELEDGRRLVAKRSKDTDLSVEAEMLRFLARHTRLPVPGVVHASEDLLLLEFVESGPALEIEAQVDAAERLAELHLTTPSAGAPPGSFGLGFDTLIGPFPQVNGWSTDWPLFFREKRLAPMLAECRRRGRMPDTSEARLRRLMDDLDSLLGRSPVPGLIHGDVWRGNVLAKGGRIVAFLDPAIYFADPEVELAFIELFGTFGADFFERYRELSPIEAGYFDRRRDIYQLYPLLVHVALFGGSYVRAVEERLSRLGY